MKLIRSEFGENYGTYSFGYALYALLDTNDRLSDVYSQGFLPDSSAPHPVPTFYMARSIRIDLSRFEMNSENRRIAKKFDGMLDKDVIPVADAAADPACIDLCISYFRDRHGESVMPEERFRYLLGSGLLREIIRYRLGGTVVAYVLAPSEDDTFHFWYSCYDLSYASQSLGLWLMLDSVRQTKSDGKKYCYLGTAYGEKGLYKTNFEALEYWDGAVWSSDAKQLREWCHADTERKTTLTDRFKQSLERFD